MFNYDLHKGPVLGSQADIVFIVTNNTSSFKDCIVYRKLSLVTLAYGFVQHMGIKAISSKTLWQRFDKLLRGAGVERCGLHSLRHTCATLLYERTGGDIKFVSNQLRHKDAGFTARTYVHQSTKRTQEILKDFQI